MGARRKPDEWPADHVERRALSALVPYARNARVHSDEQVAQIAASIREWGWTTPVLIDEAGGIIAGHGRVLAAQRLGLADVPVVVAHGWSEAQKRAYVLADNKLALNAAWDESMLRIEIDDLRSGGYDLDKTGFSSEEIGDLFDGDHSLSLPEPPESVQQNAEAIEDIKRQRRSGNADKAEKSDTEHYIVVVYASREEREAALRRLGLPADERYVLARAVSIVPRFGGSRAVMTGDRALKVAPVTKSGATG